MLRPWPLFISSPPLILKGGVHGFIDQQDGVVARLIQDHCLLPEGLVAIGPGMLSNGWLLNLSSPGCLMSFQSGAHATPSSSHLYTSVHNRMESHTPLQTSPLSLNLCPWSCIAHVLGWKGFWTLSWCWSFCRSSWDPRHFHSAMSDLWCSPDHFTQIAILH